MSSITKSYLKVHYELRPSKQVERRMIVNALQLMGQANFPISDYNYLGFGSIYFVDFILFHKYLGIDKMVSIEIDESIRNRVKYNCPFGESIIDIVFGPVGKYLPTISGDTNYILWLDYDSKITKDILSDIFTAAAILRTGSVIMVTVDIVPPNLDEKPGEQLSGPKAWCEYYKNEAGNYFDLGWEDVDFARSNLSNVNFRILYNAIRHGLSGRKNVEFIPIFKFAYADGHEMITLGGIIGGDTEKRNIISCNFRNSPYIVRNIGDAPYEIRTPKLTRKEKMLLDGNMPCPHGWKPKEFEISADDINAYKEIYRFYPHYAELLLS